MLDIDYTGLFNEDNITNFLRKQTYEENISLYKKIYKHYLNYRLQKFNPHEIIDLKFLLLISIIYKYQYEDTKNLIYQKSEELIQARFHLGKLYLRLLKTTEEKETWLDNTIKFYLDENSELSIRSLCNFLEDIDEIKNINKNKYKEIYADTCVNIASKDTGIRANHWYSLALPVYKELNLKNKYFETLKQYDENVKTIQNELHTFEFSVEDTELKKESFKNNKIIEHFFKTESSSVEQQLHYLCSVIEFKNFGKFQYRYIPFYIETKLKGRTPSLIDHCSLVTFSGNKTVKNENWSFEVNMIGRNLNKLMSIIPALKGFLDSISSNEELIEKILNSKLIFENDKKHIHKAINFFLEEDYDTFIYIIIPNFEKILRNLLTLNGIPDYTNKGTEPKYQVTLNLTETLNIIRTNKLLPLPLIDKLSQELNEEEYENYRNKLSHREDDSIFSKTVAYDLFLLFIQLTHEYPDNNIDIYEITSK